MQGQKEESPLPRAPTPTPKAKPHPVDGNPLWTSSAWRASRGAARPPDLAHRKPPTGAKTTPEVHSYAPPHPCRVVRVGVKAKAIPRPLVGVLGALACSILPGGAGPSIGRRGQITLCRVLPVRRGYRLRGVWR